MFILFSLIVMRMSGAIALNPIFGRNNFPSSAKAAFPDERYPGKPDLRHFSGSAEFIESGSYSGEPDFRSIDSA